MRAQTRPAIPALDERFKIERSWRSSLKLTNDTGVATNLAKAVFDESRKFSKRRNPGPNAIDMERSKVLADVREVDVRRALVDRELRMCGS